MLLTACSNNKYEHLTSIDVQKVDSEGNYGDIITISDEETIDETKQLFKQIKWESGVEAEMPRREDVLVKLFYTMGEDEPELRYEYRIWVSGDGYATLISNKKDEGYGTLNEEDAKRLKEILLN